MRALLGARSMQITRDELREIADPGSWARGLEYFESERVLDLIRDEESVIASVQGEFLYRVRLTRREGRLDSACSCPMGLSGIFCKHCVAAGLASIEGPEAAATPHAAPGAKASSPGALGDNAYDRDLQCIRKHLLQRDSSELVEIVLNAAAEDESLLRSLTMEAARGGGTVDVATMKRSITAATRTGGYVRYNESHSFARGTHAAVAAIAKVLGQGFPRETIELTEHALRRVERALLHMDDSAGHMRPIMDDLQSLHHAACLAARPDPVKLARHLFKWELDTDWDTFYGAAETYADVLGDVGLAEYRRLAEAQWHEMPQLDPGQESAAYEHPRFRLTAIMEALARVSGDVEALVAVMSRNLSSAYQYLEIAEAYKEAGRVEKALAWAERGVETFPASQDDRVRDFLALEYSRLGRHHDALAMVWQTFLCSLDVPSYERLKAHADQVGEWPHWRGEAVDHLGSLRDARASRPRHATSGLRPLAFPMPDYNFQLVGFYLWEKDVEAAWAEACEHGCPRWQWLDLAHVRETTHPEGSLPIYQAEVLHLVRATGGSYREPFELVTRIRALFSRMGQEDQFQAYIATLRKEFSRKRNFMRLLDSLD
jgi:tetratricopeptide (TPR) repeat protein